MLQCGPMPFFSFLFLCSQVLSMVEVYPSHLEFSCTPFLAFSAFQALPLIRKFWVQLQLCPLVLLQLQIIIHLPSFDILGFLIQLSLPLLWPSSLSQYLSTWSSLRTPLTVSTSPLRSQPVLFLNVGFHHPSLKAYNLDIWNTHPASIWPCPSFELVACQDFLGCQAIEA